MMNTGSHGNPEDTACAWGCQLVHALYLICSVGQDRPFPESLVLIYE